MFAKTGFVLLIALFGTLMFAAGSIAPDTITTPLNTAIARVQKLWQSDTVIPQTTTTPITETTAATDKPISYSRLLLDPALPPLCQASCPPP